MTREPWLLWVSFEILFTFLFGFVLYFLSFEDRSVGPAERARVSELGRSISKRL